jgi:putative transcriptional regulator
MIPAATGEKLRQVRNTSGHLLAAALAVVLAGIGAGAPVSALSAADAPTAGSFLVATRDLQESWFSQTVILLVQHDESGTMGLVINQPSEIQLTEMLPEVSHLPESDRKLYIGGPVATYGVTILIQSDRELKDAEHVFGNVYASGSRELLIEMLYNDESAHHVHLYAGHSGWSPGQLDREIARGSWAVIPADEGMIFSADPAQIWRKLAPPERRMIVRLDRSPSPARARH